MADTVADITRADVDRAIRKAHGLPPVRTSFAGRTALVASAERIRVGDRAAAKRIADRRARASADAWQDLAWRYFDDVGEVKYGVNYFGNALSQVYLFAATRPDSPEDEPAAVEASAGGTAALAADLVSRVESDQGGQAEILRELGVNLNVAGECYLVGRDGPLPDGTLIDEEWEVFSIEELEVKPDGSWRLVDAPSSGRPRELGDDDWIVRVWIKHPRRSSQPDSPLRGVLSACEELLLVERATRAAARSRLLRGILKVPQELSFGPATTEDGNPIEDADPTEDPFLRELLDTATAAVGDESSPSALVPMTVTGPLEALKGLEHLDLAMDLDPALEERFERALRRLGHGINLPPEVITGMADLNHWTAWQVDDSTFRKHIRPLLVLICDALTVGFLRPQLIAAGVTPEVARRHLVWFNPRDLVVDPDRSEAAVLLYDRGELSGEVLREEHGFTDKDAPDAAELERRRAEGRAPTVGPNAPPEGEEGPPPEEEPEAETASAAPTAAPTAADLRQLGDRQAHVDRQARDRLEVALEASLRAALTRAGNRARSRAQRDATASEVARSADSPAEVVANLGEHVVHALGLDEDELLAGAFDEMRPQFERIVGQAQRAALRLIPGGLEDDERREAEQEMAAALDDAWTWLRGRMLDLARERLYDPHPEAPAEGEWDGAPVPYAIVREAVARAGGVDTTLTAAIGERLRGRARDAWAAIGVAAGSIVRRLLTARGIVQGGQSGGDGRGAAFEWDYGDFGRERPFEPHEDLDGLQFANFDDPALEVQGSFPETSHYAAGDHDGCRCGVKFLWELAPAAAPPPVQVEVPVPA